MSKGKRVLSGHEESINCIDTSWESNQIIGTGSDDKSVRIWDLRSNRAKQCIFKCFEDSVDSFKFDVNDSHTVYAASGNCLYQFDLRVNEVLIKSPTFVVNDLSADDIDAISLSPDGRLLAISDDNGVITVLKAPFLQTKSSKRQFSGIHSSLVNAIAFNSTKPNCFVTGGFDCMLCSWDLNSLDCLPMARLNISEIGKTEATELKTTGPIFNPPFIQAVSYTSNGLSVVIALGDGSVSLNIFIT